MYLIIIAWIYVVLMMAVAEGTSTTGTVLGAIVTFLLYGVGPAGLVAYLMGAPARNKRNKKRREEAELAFAQQASPAPEQAAASASDLASIHPDAAGHAASSAEAVAEAVAIDSSVAAVRKEN
jgi:hypothetical protein